MKGVVFVELLAMADATVGEDVVDEVISGCPLASKGAYTRVGNYPASELGHLVGGLGKATGATVEALQRGFGRWMLRHFVQTHPSFFQAHPDSFSMLESIDDEVHAEVRKLDPDAELPHFVTMRVGDDALHMTYSSPRRLIAFCHGLIEACAEHYGETVEISCKDVSTSEMGIAEFMIRRTEAWIQA